MEKAVATLLRAHTDNLPPHLDFLEVVDIALTTLYEVEESCSQAKPPLSIVTDRQPDA